MAIFSKEKYWKALRFKYRQKFLQWIWSEKEDGTRYQQFLYRTGLQEKIIKWIISLNRRQGFNIDYIIEKWHKKTGILKVDAEKLLKKNTKSLQIWELEHLLNSLDFEVVFKDFEIVIKFRGARTYTAAVEKGRLIIVANQNPHFVINMDAHDYYDFSVDFYKKEKFLKISERKVTQFIFEALRYYFLDQAKLEKLPFNERKMRELLKEKFWKEEMFIKK
ncbi:hypothetical protein [uncultured Chryseobacterium sp.]|uniref:hypothetical protein n=1 Tax=uncultured Chryseobacterium sp. TaxID=259322 RepID=UPI0025CE1D22|nr:hypothetical protein [uncultured Chryseobacterium sp.]